MVVMCVCVYRRQRRFVAIRGFEQHERKVSKTRLEWGRGVERSGKRMAKSRRFIRRMGDCKGRCGPLESSKQDDATTV